jgi:two-component system cell cycle sensor histidine kinase PleC
MKKVNNENLYLKKPSYQHASVETIKKRLTYYQEITDTIREPFVILDKELIVVTANQAFYKTFKVVKLETEGKLIYKLGDNQWDIKELRDLLENILPKHKFFNGFEVSHKFPSIGNKTMLLNARQIDSRQLILLALEDTTEQTKLKNDTKKMTDNLIKQKNSLQSLNDSKDEFIMMASHQLRTPATIVKTYAGMLNDGMAGELTEKQREMLGRAMSSNERQLEIIEDLLRVARVDDGKVYLEKSDCDVIMLLNQVVKEQLVMYDARKQKIVFQQTLDSNSTNLDPNLMKMVFENLLENASKYSRESQTIVINLTQNKLQTVITISDEGVGIDKKDQKKMFTKFSRIDNALSLSTVGTGLGLYWVKKIIDLHEGTIEVQSKVEEGTKFTLSLPILKTTNVPKEVVLI